MYTLTKLQLEDGKESLLPTGYRTTASMLSLFDYETDELIRDVDFQEVTEGWQVLLTSPGSHHRTSKIREIVSREKDSIVFKTQTSIYDLVRHND